MARGEVNSGQLPNPGGSVAQKHSFHRPAQAAPQGFQAEAPAKFLGRLKTARVGGGIRIADGQSSFLIGLGLGEDAAQLGFARPGGSILLLAFATGQFLGHHWHAGGIDFYVQDRNGLWIGGGPLFQRRGHFRADAIDQTMDLTARNGNPGQGQQVLAGRFVAFPGRRPRPQAHQRRRKALHQTQGLIQRKASGAGGWRIKIRAMQFHDPQDPMHLKLPVGMAFFARTGGVVRDAEALLGVELFRAGDVRL